MHLNIDELPFVTDAGMSISKCCLSGTRTSFLDDMLQWIYKPTESAEVMILTGTAGTGKSSILNSLAYKLDQTKNLGCFFGFNYSSKAKDYWKFCFSTIARQLAKGNILYQKALNVAIRVKPHLVGEMSPASQFSHWILGPLNTIPLFETVIILIDALDESGSKNIQEELFQILLNETAQLSSKIKFILTSRPEETIVNMLHAKLSESGANIFHKEMETISLKSTQHDILIFVQNHFNKYSNKKYAKHLDNIESNWQKLLVEQANGLFQWASAACLFLSNDRALQGNFFGTHFKLAKVVCFMIYIL